MLRICNIAQNPRDAPKNSEKNFLVYFDHNWSKSLVTRTRFGLNVVSVLTTKVATATLDCQSFQLKPICLFSWTGRFGPDLRPTGELSPSKRCYAVRLGLRVNIRSTETLGQTDRLARSLNDVYSRSFSHRLPLDVRTMTHGDLRPSINRPWRVKHIQLATMIFRRPIGLQ